MTSQPTPTEEIELRLEDDIAGMVSCGDHVCVVGVCLFEQINDNSAIHEPYLAVQSIEQTVPPSITASEFWLTDGTDSYSDSADSVSATALEAYVIRSQQVINRSPTMSETNVKTKLVTPFIDLLGWNIYSPEVELEYPTQSGSREKRVDYLLCSNEIPTICVEAKSLQKSLDRYVGQLSSYMRQVGADWGLLTSGERMKLLQTDFDADHPNERVVVDCSIVQLIEKREMFENITKSAVKTE